MGYKLIVKTLAEQDIAIATEWYFTKEAHLGKRFLEEIDKAIELLRANAS